MVHKEAHTTGDSSDVAYVRGWKAGRLPMDSSRWQEASFSDRQTGWHVWALE